MLTIVWHFLEPNKKLPFEIANLIKKRVRISIQHQLQTKVRPSNGPLAYFSDIFISGKNVVITAEK